MIDQVSIVGGGLAGSEAAWQAAERGLQVLLYEMRPEVGTGAHHSGDLAELVCSNSLGSRLPDRASGILISELEKMGSLLLECARKTSVPAGSALAVDREAFAHLVSQRLLSHPRIEVMRAEVTALPEKLSVIATGPLTSPRFSEVLSQLTGEEYLYFFDALAPILEADSINMDIAFRASRYGRGEEQAGDYINCPFTEEEFAHFTGALVKAERIALRSFELAVEEGVRAGLSHFFEGCLPIEVLAERNPKALAFGPMRPVGLIDPRTGKRPFAVVQLRQDNLSGSLYNLVGFQTNLTYPEQRRVFRLIPSLEKANFIRYGQMHRNTFINSPKILKATLQHKERADLLFSGQITGVEGYLGNIATGLLAGVNAARISKGAHPIELPESTMLGALCHYVTHAKPDRFQPMKAHLGLLPPLEDAIRRNKRQRAQAYADRATQKFDPFWTLAGEKLRIATYENDLGG
ncbi:MAG: methylenetetrahydrofolate--tRNA-(uracil(54)-C(5))-methyltransferase (FADH(2)-oxidizing) TrmFO [Chloroflexi bacterium RBG_16_48_8]|nr:MAG: methylenetetrahydrofolate--tRNA-(uracil(54)-C(5))-methyltransferase (FADH(2)-oxidizing) TrmFO [Chloroflexi bacterium RBG_16_48_8]